jgi:hypothetical protein
MVAITLGWLVVAVDRDQTKPRAQARPTFNPTEMARVRFMVFYQIKLKTGVDPMAHAGVNVD